MMTTPALLSVVVPVCFTVWVLSWNCLLEEQPQKVYIQTSGWKTLLHRKSANHSAVEPPHHATLHSDLQVKRQMHQRQLAKQLANMGHYMHQQGHNYFTYHWEPTWSCDFEERVGNFGDGGKWVCDTRRLASKVNRSEECNVVSVGSQNDFSFEMGIHDLNPQCNICVFDHTSSSGGAPDYIKFFQVGLGSVTQGSFANLKDALGMCGFSNKTVDVFKIDCEGCEYDIYGQFLPEASRIKQILVEIHFRNAEQTHRLFQNMTSKYSIFHKEPNLNPQSRGDCVEYGFVNTEVN